LVIGGAAEIKDRGARQHLLGDRAEIGQEAGLGGRIHVIGLGTRHHAAAAVDIVVGIGQQAERHLAGLGLGHRDLRHQEQALLGAGDRQDIALGRDHAGRERIAPREPRRHRLAIGGDARHRWVPVPELRILGDHLGDETRRLMQRVADRHDDRRRVGLGRERRQQCVELGEGVVAEPIEARIVLHVLQGP